MVHRRRLRADLTAAGLREGMSVLVHCSMREIGWIRGGPELLRDVILDIIDERQGTLVVPTQTRSKSSTSTAFKTATETFDAEELELYRKVMPGFYVNKTPSEGMGALAEAVRTHRRAYRSSHPSTSFAAVGRHAADLCAKHPLESLVGVSSPLGALRDLEGSSVLLLGVGYDKCTAFHLGEEVAYPEDVQKYVCKVGDEWTPFPGFPHRDGDFVELGERFELACPDGIRRGTVGAASTRLFPLALAADFAAEELPKLRSAH
jgi:aminoglycoside 3-N-acetyltransferase